MNIKDLQNVCMNQLDTTEVYMQLPDGTYAAVEMAYSRPGSMVGAATKTILLLVPKASG